MSRARQIGTAGENHQLVVLRRLFGPTVERAPLKGIHDHGDFINVPWLHESKAKSSGAATRPMWLKWAGQARQKSEKDAHPHRWTVRWKGDLRRNEGPYVLMEEAFYEELVEHALKGGLPL